MDKSKHEQAFAAKTDEATRERPYAHHTMAEVVESMFIHGGGVEGHTVMGCAAYDEIRRRIGSLGHEPSGYATLSDIAFVQLLRWASDQRQEVMADLVQEAARRIDMMREPRTPVHPDAQPEEDG